MMRTVLLPPDERPAHLRDPAMLAAIAGAKLELPPRELLPRFRTPGDTVGLAAWLVQAGKWADACVVSIDGLCHGGLVASRLTDEPTDEVVARLATLRRLRAAGGPGRLDAHAIITRLPDLDDATEEPAYWAEHGRSLAALSRALDQATHRADGDRRLAPGDALSRTRAAVPRSIADDLLRRRLRNHALLLASLGLAAAGTLDGLVLSADDTAPTGLPAREADWIDAWLAGFDLDARVERYAGADEVAGVRLVRWLRGHRERPRIALLDDPDLDRVAPYEAVGIRQTAAGQVQAVGGRPVGEKADADLVLAVAPPDLDGDWALAPPHLDPDRVARHERFADRVADLVDDGAWVAVADCFTPNGGSPPVVDRLRDRGVLAQLGAYAGWNTAGNTIGSAVAQAVVGRGLAGPGTPHERLLAYRLLSDVGYMAQERTLLRARRRAAGRPQEPTEAERPAVVATLADRLGERLRALGELGSRWAVDPASVNLAWGLTLACDVALEPVDG